MEIFIFIAIEVLLELTNIRNFNILPKLFLTNCAEICLKTYNPALNKGICIFGDFKDLSKKHSNHIVYE